MIMAGCDSIRDVIPFPKAQTASEIMMKSPSVVDKAQLDELGITVTVAEDNDEEKENPEND